MWKCIVDGDVCGMGDASLHSYNSVRQHAGLKTDPTRTVGWAAISNLILTREAHYPTASDRRIGGIWRRPPSVRSFVTQVSPTPLNGFYPNLVSEYIYTWNRKPANDFGIGSKMADWRPFC